MKMWLVFRVCVQNLENLAVKFQIFHVTAEVLSKLILILSKGFGVTIELLCHSK